MDQEEFLEGPSEVWAVPVQDLLRHWDPFAAWLEDPITREEVASAMAAGRYDDRCYDLVHEIDRQPIERQREYHAARIAWMVVHHDPTPIILEFGSQPHRRGAAFRFMDGNHRMAAAVYCGDHAIATAHVGDPACFARTFPDAFVISPFQGDDA